VRGCRARKSQITDIAMPKTNRPKRKPMPIRFSPEEREAIARLQLYLQKNTQAAAVRAAVFIAMDALDVIDGRYVEK
jgi:hypothetical protein